MSQAKSTRSKRKALPTEISVSLKTPKSRQFLFSDSISKNAKDSESGNGSANLKRSKRKKLRKTQNFLNFSGETNVESSVSSNSTTRNQTRSKSPANSELDGDDDVFQSQDVVFLEAEQLPKSKKSKKKKLKLPTVSLDDFGSLENTLQLSLENIPSGKKDSSIDSICSSISESVNENTSAQKRKRKRANKNLTAQKPKISKTRSTRKTRRNDDIENNVPQDYENKENIEDCFKVDNNSTKKKKKQAPKTEEMEIVQENEDTEFSSKTRKRKRIVSEVNGTNDDKLMNVDSKSTRKSKRTVNSDNNDVENGESSRKTLQVSLKSGEIMEDKNSKRPKKSRQVLDLEIPPVENTVNSDRENIKTSIQNQEDYELTEESEGLKKIANSKTSRNRNKISSADEFSVLDTSSRSHSRTPRKLKSFSSSETDENGKDLISEKFEIVYDGEQAVENGRMSSSENLETSRRSYHSLNTESISPTEENRLNSSSGKNWQIRTSEGTKLENNVTNGKSILNDEKTEEHISRRTSKRKKKSESTDESEQLNETILDSKCKDPRSLSRTMLILDIKISKPKKSTSRSSDKTKPALSRTTDESEELDESYVADVTGDDGKIGVQNSTSQSARIVESIRESPLNSPRSKTSETRSSSRTSRSLGKNKHQDTEGIDVLIPEYSPETSKSRVSGIKEKITRSSSQSSRSLGMNNCRESGRIHESARKTLNASNSKISDIRSNNRRSRSMGNNKRQLDESSPESSTFKFSERPSESSRSLRKINRQDSEESDEVISESSPEITDTKVSEMREDIIRSSSRSSKSQGENNRQESERIDESIQKSLNASRTKISETRSNNRRSRSMGKNKRQQSESVDESSPESSTLKVSERQSTASSRSLGKNDFQDTDESTNPKVSEIREEITRSRSRSSRSLRKNNRQESHVDESSPETSTFKVSERQSTTSSRSLGNNRQDSEEIPESSPEISNSNVSEICKDITRSSRRSSRSLGNNKRQESESVDESSTESSTPPMVSERSSSSRSLGKNNRKASLPYSPPEIPNIEVSELRESFTRSSIRNSSSNVSEIKNGISRSSIRSSRSLGRTEPSLIASTDKSILSTSPHLEVSGNIGRVSSRSFSNANRSSSASTDETEILDDPVGNSRAPPVDAENHRNSKTPSGHEVSEQLGIIENFEREKRRSSRRTWTKDEDCVSTRQSVISFVSIQCGKSGMDDSLSISYTSKDSSKSPFRRKTPTKGRSRKRWTLLNDAEADVSSISNPKKQHSDKISEIHAKSRIIDSNQKRRSVRKRWSTELKKKSINPHELSIKEIVVSPAFKLVSNEQEAMKSSHDDNEITMSPLDSFRRNSRRLSKSVDCMDGISPLEGTITTGTPDATLRLSRSSDRKPQTPGAILKRRGTYDVDVSVTDISILKSLSEGNISQTGLKNSEAKAEGAEKSVRFQHVTRRKPRVENNAEPDTSESKAQVDSAKRIFPKLGPSNKSVSFDHTMFCRSPCSTSTPLHLLKKDNYLKQTLKNNMNILSSKRRSRSVDETRDKVVSRIKMPNFSKIHQKWNDKLEDISEMAARKAERARLLLSGQKPTASSSSSGKESQKKVNDKPKHPKQLNFMNSQPSTRSMNVPSPIPVKNLRDKETPKKPKVQDDPKKQLAPRNKMLNGKLDVGNRNLVVKSGIPRKLEDAKSANVLKRVEEIKSIATKSKPQHDAKEERRMIMKGVRGNRRFELLMKMRNKT